MILSDLIFGLRAVFFGGSELPQRDTVEFAGNVSVADNSTTKRTVVTIGGSVAQSDQPSAGPFNALDPGMSEVVTFTNAGIVTLNSIAVPGAGDPHRLQIFATNGVTLTDEHAGSAAATRLDLFGFAPSTTVKAATLDYDTAAQRWRLSSYPLT